HYMADQKLEEMSGRVYRVAPKGSKASVPRLDLDTPAGAVKALQSPNAATRYLAWQKLHSLEGKSERELRKLWKSKDDNMRARAWNLLVRIPGKEQKYLKASIKDDSADIRAMALRYMRVENKDAVPVVKQLVNDKSPEVLRECALSLHMNKNSDAADLWATLAQKYDGKDRWYLEALGIGAFQQDDRFFDAWLKKVGDEWNTPSGRGIVWRTRSSKAPEYIVKILQDKETSKADRDRYFRALDFIKGPEKDAAMLQLISQ
ncbi:MAG: HEAT repeat domain-containing protein, partial [Verrucomicrobiota bacterium]